MAIFLTDNDLRKKGVLALQKRCWYLWKALYIKPRVIYNEIFASYVVVEILAFKVEMSAVFLTFFLYEAFLWLVCSHHISWSPKGETVR